MELALQTLLRTGGLAALEPLAIRARRHPEFPELVLLKYSQRESPMRERAVQEARGIVLDESRDWAVVSMSYTKFFNLGEGLAADIDWDSARVQEKLDGSLLVLYPYRGAWRVQTSGSPDAGGNVVQDIRRTSSETYAELFWRTFADLGYRLPPLSAHSLAFELMTPQNRVIVRHETPRLVLHGVRDLDTLQEEDPAPWAERLGCEAVRTVPLGRGELRDAANALPATEGEGFVVVDRHWQRLKIKGQQYVAVSLLKEGWSARRGLEVVLAGEEDEVIATFPEYGDELAAIRERLLRLTGEIEADFERLRGVGDQKEFAALAAQTVAPHALFALRSGRAPSAWAWLASLSDAARDRLLGEG